MARFLSRTWAVLTTPAGILSMVAWWAWDRWRKGAHDEAAGRAEDEARKVREAGKSGKTDEVLDSFRRATDDQ